MLASTPVQPDHLQKWLLASPAQPAQPAQPGFGHFASEIIYIKTFVVLQKFIAWHVQRGITCIFRFSFNKLLNHLYLEQRAVIIHCELGTGYIMLRLI